MYYCFDTAGKPETGLHGILVMLLCTVAVTLWLILRLVSRCSGNVCTIALPLCGSLRLGFMLSR